MIYRSLIYPLLSRLDAEWTHEETLRVLELAQRVAPGPTLLRALAGRVPERPVEAFGLRFPNAVGVAAGFDKDARVAMGLGMLGFGHVEVGTLTPRPQEGNPRPRIFRLPRQRGLINRMGFPNGGVDAAVPRLAALAGESRSFLIGVSLGKQKETPLAEAVGDYLAVMRKVHRYAAYLAVNISSPNTPGLRELQGGKFLSELCGELVREGAHLTRDSGLPRRPILVKIAPDLSRAELDEILETIIHAGIDGVIATNTTLKRPGVRGAVAKEAGGLSGAPVGERSLKLISHIYRTTGGRLPIIAVGGIATPEDARRRLDAGASLVQVYTGLVYEGPCLAGRLARGIRGGGVSPGPENPL